MEQFLKQWGEAAYTSLGFFWMALWAFILGYLISSVIQVFVTEKRMQRVMGRQESKGVLLGTFFGFISSSCSFSALASAKSLFKKGAGFMSSMAFLLASTNLVIELGIIISIFLGWQFVLGEYMGGLLLIGISWLLVIVIKPTNLIETAREHLEGQDPGGSGPEPEKDWQQRIQRETAWARVARKYRMEWKMVWKDITLGFTIAGIIAVFVPDSFFQALFINSGTETTHYSFLEVLQHVVVGPVAAFLTFIGSMGNIPLAALLFGKGISFGGVMAFIFSDLVVFPVLRIHARYYGWKMSLFILFLLFTSLIGASLALHYGFAFFDGLPDPSQVTIRDRAFFGIDYTLGLNILFLGITAYLAYLGFYKRTDIDFSMGEMAPKSPLLERILKYTAWLSYAWLAIGMLLWVFYGSV